MIGENEMGLEQEGEKQKLLSVGGSQAFELEQSVQVIGWRDMAGDAREESKKMWEIAGPAILTSVAQFSIGFITVAFVGHLGDLELAAVSIVQNVIEGFVYGIMLGIGSALETLCGQAVGAGQYKMLGVYLQRSFIITLTTSLLLTPIYLFTTPLLNRLHQDKLVAMQAGKYAIWVIPQLFAYALNFPIQKFLQAQSKIWVMTIMSVLVTGLHIVLNWVLITRLGYGVVGAAMAGNVSWWVLVVGQLVYVVCGWFPEAWSEWSISAFRSLSEFVGLSLSSAVMLCLELWYNTLIILMVGWLPNPRIAVDAISICMNIQLWTLMITLGFNAAVSVRVSNELGAKNPKLAKLSVFVSVVTSTVFGMIFTVAIILSKDIFPKIFTKDVEVIKETTKLGHFLAVAILINSIQPVLHGVAVGAGWQFRVAVINIMSYYVIGIPVGALLGFKLNRGVEGIWLGMLAGTVLQTGVLLWTLHQTNWTKEVLQAKERVQRWTDTSSYLTPEEEGASLVLSREGVVSNGGK